MFFTKFCGFLALLAFACLCAQVTLQVLEMRDYEAPPSAWAPGRN